ncbi:MAG: hypothetical protein QNL33_10545 [Akkermansiaceae bacterium]
MKPKILILTASFGDGHNSAARHLAEALAGQAEVKVADPCHLGNPVINRVLCRGYREITTYAPRIWAWVYRSTDRQDFTKPLPFIAKTEDAVATLLDDFQPDLVVNTYPLYPYMVDRLFNKERQRVPVITVITDSIEVNAAWSRSPSDHFLITDSHTLESLSCQKVPAEKTSITGFPVSPRFEELKKIPSTDPVKPFRVLFFPTARSPHVGDIIRAVLKHDTEITVVLGRNLRRLYKKTRKIKDEFPGRVKIKGWTRKVPELLSSHHLIIGKAGGATVHEAIAAECPMLVHHIVPGQEEGNIELLERYQIGSLATEARQIETSLGKLLANDAQLWREQKERLATYAKPAAAREAAKLILSKIPAP